MKIIDLSRPIRSGIRSHIMTSIIPLIRHGDMPGRFNSPCEGFASDVVVMSDHCGTHMDAPFHFYRKGRTIGEIPVSRTIGPAVVCNLSRISGEQIELEQLREGIKKMKTIPRKGGFLLLKTTANIRTSGKGLSKGAAEYLVNLGISLVGTDNGDIDNSRNRGLPAHMNLLGNDVLIVESMAHLDQIENNEILLVVQPLAFENTSGSPVRPIGIFPCPQLDWLVLDGNFKVKI